MEKAIAYFRVSSKGQEDNFSLPAQEKLGREYAIKNKLEIVRVWSGYESGWGKKHRDNFVQMIDYVKKHSEVKHIIFDCLDRMTRNELDKIKITELIHNYGKLVHFSRENKIYSINSSPDDEFMMDINVAVAKKYSNEISRKVKMGLDEKASEGYYPTIAPTGYINVIKEGRSYIELDPVNAPLVKEMFEKVASGDYSLLMLEGILYAKGMRNPHRKNKVRKSTLHRMIHNEVYYGVFKWKGKLCTNAKHTPIVSKDLWDKAQEALQGKHRPHLSNKDFAYRGLLACGHCDCTVVGQIAKKKYTYYRCSFSKGQHEHAGYINEKDMPALFLPVVKAVSLPSDYAGWLETGIKEIAKHQTKLKKNQKDVLQRDYNNAHTKLKRLYDLQLEGACNKDMFLLKEKEISEDLARLKSALANCDVDAGEVCNRVHDTLELSSNLEEFYSMANDAEKAHILKLLGINYILDKENAVKANYKQSFDLLAKAKAIAEEIKSSNASRTPYAEKGSLGAKNTKSPISFTDEALNSSNFFKTRSV